ncbi:hypothetical protein EDB81DRAFT_516239 [Dactylonectria macrodidyma]|uniref:Vacuolar ATPase assembly protein VMA22 n=1 Tax=Dactylonectria macrodidyma TaxID=307937 RepID=A0A9P9ET07_9HYPO|nr:hypothetical protein EDB81DRAFT_516239 [Dactylonectria macrodidyma]
MEQEHIDQLLERYLGLLNEYTVLRQTFSRFQSGVYHNIARANFSGERGMRYGQDHYDERMQAARRLAIDVDDKLKPTFTVVNAPAEEPEEQKAETPKETEKQDGKDDVERPAKQKKNKNKNPLHWFGLLAPMPLRAAQIQSVQVVEEVIPRLVSINAEMLELEIEVRRARKRRAKAEAAAEKKGGAASVTDAQPQTGPVEAS